MLYDQTNNKDISNNENSSLGFKNVLKNFTGNSTNNINKTNLSNKKIKNKRRRTLSKSNSNSNISRVKSEKDFHNNSTEKDVLNITDNNINDKINMSQN